MNFRRYYIPNSIVFITQVTQNRLPIFDDDNIKLLRNILRKVQYLHPFSMLGYVFLPDHFHLLIQPEAGVTFSKITHSLKPNFTKTYKRKMNIDYSVKFWQKRFYDHIIRDEGDFQRHLDYIHYNLVKHNLISKPENWIHSSFFAWRERGAYVDQWGWIEPSTIGEMDLE